jgi:D-tyrosyl-tRNA(Tyr) deacylase
MRAIIQRVTEARVVIAGVVKGVIQAGLLVLLGVEEADTVEDIEWLSGKIVRLRIFRDAEGLMNQSVQESGGGILVVSQFTLFASTKKGNRPSYSRAARKRPFRFTSNLSAAWSRTWASPSKPENSARTCRSAWLTTAPSRSSWIRKIANEVEGAHSLRVAAV